MVSSVRNMWGGLERATGPMIIKTRTAIIIRIFQWAKCKKFFIPLPSAPNTITKETVHAGFVPFVLSLFFLV